MGLISGSVLVGLAAFGFAYAAAAAPPASTVYAGDPASITTVQAFRKGGPYILRGRDILGCRDGGAVEAGAVADVVESRGGVVSGLFATSHDRR